MGRLLVGLLAVYGAYSLYRDYVDYKERNSSGGESVPGENESGDVTPRDPINYAPLYEGGNNNSREAMLREIEFFNPQIPGGFDARLY
jgi:hypothetical protein